MTCGPFTSAISRIAITAIILSRSIVDELLSDTKVRELMPDPIVPWLARRPSLLDNAGAPVSPGSMLLIDSDVAHANQLDMVLDPSIQHIAEDLRAMLVTDAARAPQLALLVHAPLQ